MKKETVNKIKALKPSSGFMVETESDRKDVLRTAKALFEADVIKFRVTTSKVSGKGWKVVAI